jgi:regulatory protein
LAFGRNRAGHKIGAGHGRAPKPRRQRARDEAGGDAQKPGDSVMAAALKILARRPYSEAELRERLISRRGKDAKLVDKCIVRLKELGYVNDDLFAHNYASYRVSLKPIGRNKLARELAVRKVPRSTIEEALDLVFEETAEDALIDKAIARRIRTRGQPADRAASKRMFDHLARLGFEYDLIVRKLRKLKAETAENDE